MAKRKLTKTNPMQEPSVSDLTGVVAELAAYGISSRTILENALSALDPTLYLLIRNDLSSMNPGKAMAQASHAANLMVYRIQQRAAEFPFSALNNMLKIWQADRGFGTAIALSVSNAEIERILSEIRGTVDYAKPKETAPIYYAEWVCDPTYPFFVDSEIYPMLESHYQNGIARGNRMLCLREEYTCAYAFGSKIDLAPLVGHLPLHP